MRPTRRSWGRESWLRATIPWSTSPSSSPKGARTSAWLPPSQTMVLSKRFVDSFVYFLFWPLSVNRETCWTPPRRCLVWPRRWPPGPTPATWLPRPARQIRCSSEYQHFVIWLWSMLFLSISSIEVYYFTAAMFDWSSKFFETFRDLHAVNFIN